MRTLYWVLVVTAVIVAVVVAVLWITKDHAPTPAHVIQQLDDRIKFMRREKEYWVVADSQPKMADGAQRHIQELQDLKRQLGEISIPAVEMQERIQAAIKLLAESQEMWGEDFQQSL